MPIEALRRALALRRPAQGLIVHTDRGSEFASSDFRALLNARGAIQSMSRKANCYDNAAALRRSPTVHYTPKHGSWFNQAEIAIGLLARECLRGKRFPDSNALSTQVDVWCRHANRKRRILAWTFAVSQYKAGQRGLPTGR